MSLEAGPLARHERECREPREFSLPALDLVRLEAVEFAKVEWPEDGEHVSRGRPGVCGVVVEGDKILSPYLVPIGT